MQKGGLWKQLVGWRSAARPPAGDGFHWKGDRALEGSCLRSKTRDAANKQGCVYGMPETAQDVTRSVSSAPSQILKSQMCS